MSESHRNRLTGFFHYTDAEHRWHEIAAHFEDFLNPYLETPYFKDLRFLTQPLDYDGPANCFQVRLLVPGDADCAATIDIQKTPLDDGFGWNAEVKTRLGNKTYTEAAQNLPWSGKEATLFDFLSLRATEAAHSVDFYFKEQERKRKQNKNDWDLNSQMHHNNFGE